MPAYCPRIEIPTLGHSRYKNGNWTAQTIKLTNVDVNYIGWQLSPQCEFGMMKDLNIYESRFDFICKHADHAIISSLENSDKTLKLLKAPDDSKYRYIDIHKARVTTRQDNTIVFDFETIINRYNDVCREIQKYNSFISKISYSKDGRLNIEIQTQNYVVEEFSFEAHPANPNACFDGYMTEPQLVGSYPTNGLGIDPSFKGSIPFETKKEIFKRRVRNNLLIPSRKRGELISNVADNEMIAIETLRETITETEYRKYTKYGFIMVKGRSGSYYQIFRNRWHTKVWENGKVIEEVCVRLKDSKIPPTDNVIAFKTIIETDEQEFKKLGNVYKMSRMA